MPFPLRRLPGLVLALISLSAAGQNSLARQPPPAISNLRLLNRNSGYIFDGTVLAVERVAPNESISVATAQITFRVEQAFRGTHRGQVLAFGSGPAYGILANATTLGSGCCCFSTVPANWVSPARSAVR